MVQKIDSKRSTGSRLKLLHLYVALCWPLRINGETPRSLKRRVVDIKSVAVIPALIIFLSYPQLRRISPTSYLHFYVGLGVVNGKYPTST